MKLGIRSKLFLLSLSLIGLTLIAAKIYLSTALEGYLTERIRGDLFVRLDIVAHNASNLDASLEEIREWDAFSDQMGRLTRARVSVIRRDGVVVGDSEVVFDGIAKMENHARRPEVLRALASGQGESCRYSETIKTRFLYAAKRLSRGNQTLGLVRLAIPLTEIDESVSALKRLIFIAALLALVLAILLSAAATQLASRNLRALTAIAKTMQAGDLSVRARVAGHDEFADLARALDGLAKNLSRSMAELRSERDRLDGILTAMREAVLLVDREGRVVLINQAFREIFLVRSEVVGQPLIQAVRHAELKSLLDQAVESATPVSGEIEVTGLKPRTLLVHASTVDSDRGTLLVFVDVTDIRRLESLRRDFVANASHELRTPVASARSALETLRIALASDPEAVGEFLEIIDRNVERLNRLIIDLLDLSRIESREFKLVFEPVMLAQMAATALALFSDKAEQKKTRVIQTIAADLPAVRADKRAVEQILANLVDNAIKYSPEGAEVRLNAAEEGPFIRVSVQDSGPGIEPRHQPRLFERFYRVDPGRSRELGGTGLGLSIVKHLVEAMGGTVQIESEVGIGSTFSFTLRRFQA
ncbi:MAG: PAS domain-containing protein [Deltaproteobacteria bacterium]|nr:PAS domain-containing protein [Deltaproteobacteria bacterium]